MAFFYQNTEDAKDPRILTTVFIYKKENGNGKKLIQEGVITNNVLLHFVLLPY